MAHVKVLLKNWKEIEYEDEDSLEEIALGFWEVANSQNMMQFVTDDRAYVVNTSEIVCCEIIND